MKTIKKIKILSEFCNLMSFVYICLKGGIDLLMAFNYIMPYIEQNYIKDEFRQFFINIKVGKRSEAFNNFCLEVEEINVFFRLLNITIQHGGSVGNILEQQILNLQSNLLYFTEKQLKLTPFKLLIPTILTLFPASLIILLYPLYKNIIDNL